MGELVDGGRGECLAEPDEIIGLHGFIDNMEGGLIYDNHDNGAM